MKPRYTFKTDGTKTTASSLFTTYKLRAECMPDLESLRALIPLHSVEYSYCQRIPGFIDCECVIMVRGFNLEAMREFCRGVVDGHVMLQTIQPESLYTGERDYALE